MKHPCLHGSLISCTQCHSACGPLLQMSCWRMQPKVPSRKNISSVTPICWSYISLSFCAQMQWKFLLVEMELLLFKFHTHLSCVTENSCAVILGFWAKSSSIKPSNNAFKCSSFLHNMGMTLAKMPWEKKLMQTKKQKVLCYIPRRVVWMLKQWVLKGDVMNGKHKTSVLYASMFWNHLPYPACYHSSE